MTDGGGRDERGGVRWWCVLPDVAATAHLLTTETETVVAHASGRPWLLGHGITAVLRVTTTGRTRVAMIGTCLVSDRELHAQVERAAQRGDYDALTAFPGSYHLAVTWRAGAVVFGDVAGFRRVFITRVGAVAVAASHADVLRRLVGAQVSRTWLAARLTVPEMPNVLRESLSPFEGIHAIPSWSVCRLAGGCCSNKALLDSTACDCRVV
jgi:asparagine synthase (glutamine-hydrolysing)